MSQIIYSQTAVEHLQHIAEQWRKEPQIGKMAIQIILQHIERLDVIRHTRTHEIGDIRLLKVKIGSNGFVVHYCYLDAQEQFLILAIKSYQDAGFSE